ncbi:LytTR family transcriptional regulator [Rudanella paleaurantiibacter]|uniref:LytTR family transcriptional regulator n=1 Tax=Rudanella paleaurantiibacter TaxID=2614655 RepID=A0A7J5U1P2_9BACT|nr:LytTR family DNA-binding domain-containing protein [Rudanella paleaurantiibacter]KAB7731724.1 LytTR family transcriptional regulator [Rudanella paleaurantiibacter]
MNPLLPLSNHTSPRTNQVATIRVNDPLYGWRTRSIHELVMIRGAKGYSWLHWRDGSRHIMAYTLKHYELQLPNAAYIRIHQNCLVNRAFVQKVQLTHKGPMLHLSSGEKVAVSRRRWVSVKRALNPNPWTGVVEDHVPSASFAASDLD